MNKTGWYSDWNPEMKGWEPSVEAHTGGAYSIDLWFDSKDACDQFIKTELLGLGLYDEAERPADGV